MVVPARRPSSVQSRLPLGAESLALDFVNQLLAAGDRVPAELPFNLASQGRNNSVLDLTERRGHLVHQVPDPGHPKVVKRGHQPEPADSGQHPDVGDVGLEVVELGQEGMNIEGVDPMRLGFVEELGHQGAPSHVVIDPHVGQPERPVDVGRAGDRRSRRGGQDAHFVASGPQVLDDLPAAHLVAAQGVGRIEVADHQDFHAATSHARAIKGS